MHRKLRLLAQRACTPGIVDSTQLGVTVHSLHQLDLLDLQNAALLQLISDHISAADVRSQANVLHALALETRTMYDVKVALPDLVDATLRDVQEELSESVDQLSAPEAILAMEAMIRLLPYGGVGTHAARRVGVTEARASTGVVDGLLLRELQDRSLELVTAVERPVDLIGITRVVTEGLQLPRVKSSQLDGDDNDEDEVLDADAEKDLGAQWSELVLKPLLRALEARVDGWRSQDLMSLVDALVLRGSDGTTSRGGASPSAASTAARRHDESPSSRRSRLVLEQTSSTPGSISVPDACRPFIGRLLLERVAPTVAELTPSQSTAWLLRLVRLNYHREGADGAFKGLFLGLIARLEEPATRAAMTPSQISTCACLLSRVLREDGATSPHVTSHFSVTDTDTCLRVLIDLQASLCAVLEPLYGRASETCRSPEAAAAARTHVLPVLLALPEDVLLSCARRGFAAESRTPSSRHNPHDAFGALRSRFPGSLRWSAAFVLRHFRQLPPREKVHIATFAFHWNLYGANGGSTASIGDSDVRAGVVGRDPLTASTLLAALAMRSTGSLSSSSASSASLSAADSAEGAKSARQMVALCGLIQEALSSFNTLDCLQLLNEATATAYIARGTSSFSASSNALRIEEATTSPGSRGADDGGDRIVPGMDATAALHRLLLDLHGTLQSLCSTGQEGAPHRASAPSSSSARRPSSGQLEEIPTSALVRYLTSMSKLGVRVKAPYYNLLDTVQTRTLTRFEAIAVLGVMSRHHLHRPAILKSVVRSLPSLTAAAGDAPNDALYPAQKALLLKYLGQAGAQRFVRCPSSPYFEAGAFFASADDVRRLSFLELIFCVNGLTALRQYTSPSLSWVLDVMQEKAAAADPAASTAADTKTATAEGYARLLAHVRSATTQAELLSALVHLGVPCVPLALVEATARNLRDTLLSSRSLFVDLARVADMWSLLPAFLNAAAVHEDDEERAKMSALHPGRRTPRVSHCERVVEALSELQRTAAMLVRARLLDMANPATLRPNSFLLAQLTAGIQLGGQYLRHVSRNPQHHYAPADTFALTMSAAASPSASAPLSSSCSFSPPTRSVLPADTSETLELLVKHVDLNHLNVILSNPAQLVDAAVLGLFLLTVLDHASPPRLLFHSEATVLLTFVLKHAQALRVKDALLVWSAVDELVANVKGLVPTSPRPSTSPTAQTSTETRGERVRAAWSQHIDQDVIPLLDRLRESCRTTVTDAKALPKLSPVEERLLKTQLS